MQTNAWAHCCRCVLSFGQAHWQAPVPKDQKRVIEQHSFNAWQINRHAACPGLGTVRRCLSQLPCLKTHSQAGCQPAHPVQTTARPAAVAAVLVLHVQKQMAQGYVFKSKCHNGGLWQHMHGRNSGKCTAVMRVCVQTQHRPNNFIARNKETWRTPEAASCCCSPSSPLSPLGWRQPNPSSSRRDCTPGCPSPSTQAISHNKGSANIPLLLSYPANPPGG